MYPKLKAFLASSRQHILIENSPRLPELQRFASYLIQKKKAGQVAKLVVICTHNSRRSHIGQFWLAAIAHQQGISVQTFSGGTEATACHPNTVAALQRAGAQVAELTGPPNPHYAIQYADGLAIEAWSKAFTDTANPQRGFAALMVCGEADAACPFVPGAEARFGLPYLDPKYADGTPEQDAAYNLACQTIAAEMAWVLN